MRNFNRVTYTKTAEPQFNRTRGIKMSAKLLLLLSIYLYLSLLCRCRSRTQSHITQKPQLRVKGISSNQLWALYIVWGRAKQLSIEGSHVFGAAIFGESKNF
jgi:hypothetical protein